jgi:hypothetical protein
MVSGLQSESFTEQFIYCILILPPLRLQAKLAFSLSLYTNGAMEVHELHYSLLN